MKQLGGEVEWGEAIDLFQGLAADTTTRLCASLQGWDYPFSHEAMLLADLYDLTALVAADPKKRGRVKPHPRPWKTVEVQKFGDTAGRSPDEVRAILDAAARGSSAA